MTPPPGYQPYGAGGFGAPQTNKKATAALVFGILGLLCLPVVFSVLALVFGIQSRNEIDRSNGSYSGRGMATAGIWLGAIGAALGVFIIIRAININT
jgi:hypothetical protein